MIYIYIYIYIYTCRVVEFHTSVYQAGQAENST